MVIHVIKLGGSSIGTEKDFPEGMKEAECRIRTALQSYDKLMVIISAFKGKTRELQEKSLSRGYARNSPQEAEMLSRGENESSKFLYNYLRAHGYKASIIRRRDIPLITDDNFCSAQVLLVQTHLIEQKLKDCDILIIPGFVGRTIDKIFTVLGFEGSDTSAAYIAGAMKCGVSLFKDVMGIYTMNPRIEGSLARFLPCVNINQAIKLALLGNKIVHSRALIAAANAGSEIRIRPYFEDSGGSIIAGNIAPAPVAGITYNKFSEKEVVISAVGEKLRQKQLFEYLKEISPFEYYPTSLDGTISLKVAYESYKDILKRIHNFYGLDSDDGGVHFVGNGKIHANN